MRSTFAVAGLALAAIAAPTQASLLFSDSFELQVVGQQPGGGGGTPAWTTIVDNGTTTQVRVQSDAANLFGAGSTNRVLRLLDNNAGTGITATVSGIAGATNVATLEFDFVEPAAVAPFTDALFIHLGNGAPTSDANRRAQIELDDTTLRSGSPTITNAFQAGARQRLTIVINNSGAPLAYAGGNSVANQRYDIFVNGVLLGDDRQYTNGALASGAVINSFNFQTFSAAQQEVLVDNLRVYSGAVIPEPASLTAVSFVGAMLLRRRR